MVAIAPRETYLCLNSGLVGSPYNLQINEEPLPGYPPMASSRLEDPVCHPFVRSWNPRGYEPYGSNVDPYRQALSFNYTYTAASSGPHQWLKNEFVSRDAERTSMSVVRTPYHYMSGSGFSPVPGALAGSVAVGSPGPLTLHINDGGWNQAIADDPSISSYYEDFLRQENMGQYNEGTPYFFAYIMGGVGYDTFSDPQTRLGPTQANQLRAYPGLIAPLFSLAGGGGPEFYDHTCTLTTDQSYQTDTDGIPFAFQNVNCTVTSHYNYYLDTSPDYEEVIAPSSVPECLLPNYYMLEACVQDALVGGDGAATGVSYPYLPQVSIASSDSAYVDLFMTLPAGGGFSPEISQGFWQLYVDTLTDTLQPGLITPAHIESYKKKYQNIVIAAGDLKFLDSSNGLPWTGSADFDSIEAWPFYNKIEIDFEEKGDIGSNGFFEDMWDTSGPTGMTGVDARQRRTFIKMLQLMVANSYNPTLPESPVTNLTTGLPPEAGFFNARAEQLINGVIWPRMGHYINGVTPLHRSQIELDFNMITDPFDHTAEVNGINLSYRNKMTKVCAELDVLGNNLGLNASYAAYLTDPSNKYRYYYSMLVDGTSLTNYSILRDPGELGDASLLPPGSIFSSPLVLGDPITTTGIYDYLVDGVGTRTMNRVQRGGESPKAPLMYMIEKRIVPDGEVSADQSIEPVQRIFITREFNPLSPKTVTYYDTQVKYGVKYQYDVRLIWAVFGTAYQYSSPQILTGHDIYQTADAIDEVHGRPLGNALGFYNEEDSDITTLGDAFTVSPAGTSQFNYRSNLDPDPIGAAAGTAAMTGERDPSVYFDDSAPTSPLNTTDVGEDGGWDESWVPDLADPERPMKKYGQTGYFIFGNLSQAEIGAEPWTEWGDPEMLAYDWVPTFSENLIAADPAATTLNTTDAIDNYGNVIGQAPPGGMYRYQDAHWILNKLYVKVNAGAGYDGNNTGGLVGYSAGPTDDWDPTPADPVVLPDPGEILVPPRSVCDWVDANHAGFHNLFKDWYGALANFEPIGFWGTLRWGWQSVVGGGGTRDALTHDAYAIRPGVSVQRYARWYAGDSYYLTEDGASAARPLLFSSHSPDGWAFRRDRYNSEIIVPGSRQYACWYAPNWCEWRGGTGHTNPDINVFKHHNSHQIMYWLYNGHASGENALGPLGAGTDPLNSSRTMYPHAQSDLGSFHGQDIIYTFMQYFNSLDVSTLNSYGIDSRNLNNNDPWFWSNGTWSEKFRSVWKVFINQDNQYPGCNPQWIEGPDPAYGSVGMGGNNESGFGVLSWDPGSGEPLG